MLTPKELKKLAAACRQAGIKHYKTQDFEFTLSEEIKVKTPRKSKEQQNLQSIQQEKIDSDEMTPEQLLFWSSAMGEEKEVGN